MNEMYRKQYQTLPAYNGYTNKFTWAVELWLDNEESSYYDMLELAESALDEHGESAAYHLEAAIKDYIEEHNPLVSAATLYSDLLGAALAWVNWREIAENYISAVEEV